ncbi:MAG: alanine dehydrogenase [Myxococcota bacterium]|jgi:alanine dehydrogenase
MLTLGVVGTALKQNERRAPLHPKDLACIKPDLRAKMYLERGYGERFGVSDAVLSGQVAGLLSRKALFERCDVMLLPKPTEADFPYFREGQVIWGWPHCVQGPQITQVAIDRRMTLIAWEEMHQWRGEEWDLHVFHLNNELAGYCSVLHALSLRGITGHYGPHRRACVISFGSVGRGAIHALQGLGFGDVTVFTKRPGHAVRSPIPRARHWQFRDLKGHPGRAEVLGPDGPISMPEALGHFDVVVNAILQDTENPLMFVQGDERRHLRDETLIIDVSCDDGMGFDFARPTSFADPMFAVGERGIDYYAVDHSPSYLWNTATAEISKAVRPFIRPMLQGPAGWDSSRTLSKAIEIREGVVQNPRILSFQGRAAEYPHERSAG